MALTLVNANLVRQKAYNAVYGTGKIVATLNSVSPYHFYAVKSVFLHLAANKGNPDLQFLPYAAEDIVAAGGALQSGIVACHIYVWFMKARRTSGTTASFQQIFDAVDNNTATATVATQLINATGQSAIFVWPDGFPTATGLTVAADTTVAGATESAAADAT